jgi:hypothetical protein
LIAGSKPSLGSFVLALPVDSEFARAGGVQHFNLPKSLVQFRMRWLSTELQASIASTGGTVLSMMVPLRMGIPIRAGQLTIFSLREGQLLTTRVDPQWPAKLDLVGRPTLAVNNRSHPIGREVAGLALEVSRVLAVVHGPLQYAALPILNPPGSLGGSQFEAPRRPNQSSFPDSGWSSQPSSVAQATKDEFDVAGPSTVRSRTD